MRFIQNKLRNLIVLLSISFFMAGCHTVHVKEPGYGPPPHAPAHGYRAKHHGHDLVYDAGLGVYIVVGLHNVFFHDGHYYRLDGGKWYFSDDPNKNWKQSKNSSKKLPPGLAKKR